MHRVFCSLSFLAFSFASYQVLDTPNFNTRYELSSGDARIDVVPVVMFTSQRTKQRQSLPHATWDIVFASGLSALQLSFGRFAASCSRSIPKLSLGPRFFTWLPQPSPLHIFERGILDVFLLSALGNWSATLSSIHPDCFKAASKRSIISCGETDG